jgi:hypothetical protein
MAMKACWCNIVFKLKTYLYESMSSMSSSKKVDAEKFGIVIYYAYLWCVESLTI